MAKLADDMLKLAKENLILKQGRPSQAKLRRSISNSYYAVFHLILEEGVSLLVGQKGVDAQLIFYFQRSFEHTGIKDACELIIKQKLPSRHAPIIGPFPAQCKSIASLFIELQKARHRADYDLSSPLSKSQAGAYLAIAEQVFSAWSTAKQTEETALKQFHGLMLLNKSKKG